jgi:hypothetical protein
MILLRDLLLLFLKMLVLKIKKIGFRKKNTKTVNKIKINMIIMNNKKIVKIIDFFFFFFVIFYKFNDILD